MIRKGDKLKLEYMELILIALSDETCSGEVLIQAPGLSSCFYIPVKEVIVLSTLEENSSEPK